MGYDLGDGYGGRAVARAALGQLGVGSGGSGSLGNAPPSRPGVVFGDCQGVTSTGKAYVLLDGQSSVLLMPIADDLLGAALVGRRVAVLGFGPSTWIVALAVGATRVEAWQAPALLNGWVNYGAPHNPAGYWKDPHGVVHLRGLVRFGSAATAIVFALPAGYRPEYREIFATDSNLAFARVDVTPAGEVLPVVASTVYLALDGISFRAV